jgi:diphthine-ammonia ligase
MTLPPLLSNEGLLENFKFQTVLSLQHLFRIGTAMSVSWFTGTVAYLPFSQTSSTTLSTPQRARIAGQAWTQVHARPRPLDSNSLDFPDEDDDGRPRDLWEEKYYAGLETMGRGAETKVLPDWETVSFEHGEGSGLGVPSFWAAEVEELPRGAGIEWATLSGVVGGAVKVRNSPSLC